MSSHAHSHGGADCTEHRNRDWARQFLNINTEEKQNLTEKLKSKIEAHCHSHDGSHGHSHNGIITLFCGLVFGAIGLLTGDSREDENTDELTESSDHDSILFGSGHAEPKPIGWSINPTLNQHSFKPASLNNYWSFYIPSLGRFRIVKNQRGLSQVGFVFSYWIYGNWSTFSTIIIPQYPEGNISLIFIIYYLIVSYMCLWSLIMASMSDPGKLNPEIDRPQVTWNQCKVCNLMRPPLAHHCRKCGQCVRRMDHHCPWINNCVGEENQFAFILLLLYSFLLSLNTFVVVVLQMNWLNKCSLCDQEVLVLKYQTYFFISMIILSLSMAFGSFTLLIDQHMAVLYELPGLEFMKMKQEHFLTGKSISDDISWKRSFHEIYADLSGTTKPIYWLIPIKWTKCFQKEAIV